MIESGLLTEFVGRKRKQVGRMFVEGVSLMHSRCVRFEARLCGSASVDLPQIGLGNFRSLFSARYELPGRDSPVRPHCRTCQGYSVLRTR